MNTSIARKTRPADPAIVSYLIDAEFDVVIEATTSDRLDHEPYGLEITTVRLDNGNKIVYQAIDGVGEAFYYDASGHCYLTVEE